jgi:hypothetical protein
MDTVRVSCSFMSILVESAKAFTVCIICIRRKREEISEGEYCSL